MFKKLAKLTSETSGAVAAITAIALVVICGAAALTIDVGHLTSAKNELQIASEASALAGARALCTQVPDSLSFVDNPNWVSGTAKADDILKKNAADGALLANADIQAGFWDLNWHWNTAPRDSTTGAIQLLPQSTKPDKTHIPAVRVKIDKAAGVNSGKVQFSFARVMGIEDASPSAQAVAALFPRKGKGIKSVPAQSCLPFATPISWVKNTIDADPPTTFKILSTYHDGIAEDGGEWTTFKTEANDVPAIRDLIFNGNPTPLTVGDPIWIQPGTETTLYRDLQIDKGKIGLLPIVKDGFETNAFTPLLAFVAFYLEDCGGSGKNAWVRGHFVKGFVDYDATPGSGNPVAPGEPSEFGASAATPALVR